MDLMVSEIACLLRDALEMMEKYDFSFKCYLSGIDLFACRFSTHFMLATFKVSCLLI